MLKDHWRECLSCCVVLMVQWRECLSHCVVCALCDSKLGHGLHNGEFLVILKWCILGWSVQVLEGSKNDK